MNKRFKTWLFRVSVLAALLGPLVIGGLNRTLDSRFETDRPVSDQSMSTDLPQLICIPSLDQAAYEQLDTLTLSQENDLTISLRMAELYSADQAARQLPVSDIHKVNMDDTARRVEVLGYILNGQIHTARNLVYAAFIFQHGDCSEHYHFANRLAQIAMDTGYADARWIYAATLDRYLMSLGKPQKFGTQYARIDGEFRLYPVDPTTTDTERAKYNVPPLNEAIKQKLADNKTGNNTSIKHWLETWWLTLIGTAFAVLGAIISVVDAKPNPFLGRIVLITTLVIYSLSVVGHYAQVNALAHGTFDAQQKGWEAVNAFMIVAWFIFASIGAFRLVRAKTHPA